MKEEHRIDYRKYVFSGKDRLRYGAEGLGLGLLVVWLAYQRLAALPLAGLCLIFFLRSTHQRLAAERRRTLQYHFRGFLTTLHTTLSAGYALENAIPGVVRDMEKLYGKRDVLVRELRAITWQMQTQRPVEELFRELGERSGVEDIRQFGEMLMIAKRTGGSMDRVLEAAWRTLCEKIDTAKEIDTILAAKRYEQQLMSLMPAGVILYLKVGFSGFLDPLYTGRIGPLVMTGCLALYLAAFLLGRRLIRQEI